MVSSSMFRIAVAGLAATISLGACSGKEVDTSPPAVDTDTDTDSDADSDTDADTDVSFQPDYARLWGYAGVMGGELGDWGFAGESDDYPPMLFIDLFDKAYFSTGADEHRCQFQYEFSGIQRDDPDAYYSFETTFSTLGAYGSCDLDSVEWGDDPADDLGITGGVLSFGHPSGELVSLLESYYSPTGTHAAAGPFGLGVEASFGEFDDLMQVAVGLDALYSYVYQADDSNHTEFSDLYTRDQVEDGSTGVFYLKSPYFRVPAAGEPPTLAPDHLNRSLIFGIRAGVVEPWSYGLSVDRDPILSVGLLEEDPWNATGHQDMACIWLWTISGTTASGEAFEVETTFSESRTWGNCEDVDTGPIGGEPGDLVEGDGVVRFEPLSTATISWLEENEPSIYANYSAHLFAVALETGAMDDVFDYAEGIQPLLGRGYLADEVLNTDWSTMLSADEAIAGSDGVYFVLPLYNLRVE